MSSIVCTRRPCCHRPFNEILFRVQLVNTTCSLKINTRRKCLSAPHNYYMSPKNVYTNIDYICVTVTTYIVFCISPCSFFFFFAQILFASRPLTRHNATILPFRSTHIFKISLLYYYILTRRSSNRTVEISNQIK